MICLLLDKIFSKFSGDDPMTRFGLVPRWIRTTGPYLSWIYTELEDDGKLDMNYLLTAFNVGIKSSWGFAKSKELPNNGNGIGPGMFHKFFLRSK